MQTTFVSVLTQCLLLVACTSPVTTSPALNSAPGSDPWDDRSIFKNGLVESQQSALNGLEDASVYHIDLTIADDMLHLTGHEEVRYTNTEGVPLHELEFRLFPNVLGGSMEVSNVFVNDRSLAPAYDLENSLMTLPFGAALEPGQSAVIRMDFRVSVPQNVKQNYGVIAYYDDVLALAHAYPMIPVYDDEGWNAEIPSNQGDVTFTDASFYLVKITAPKNLVLVTSGTEIGRATVGASQTLTVADGPARDFYLAASPDYEKVSETIDGITINSYAPADLQDGAKAALEIAAKSIDLYSQLYTPYPYTELDIVSTPTLAGGIEYPGLIVGTSNAYKSSDENGGVTPRQRLEGIIAHEVGHQWFYNLVGDDQLDDP